MREAREWAKARAKKETRTIVEKASRLGQSKELRAILEEFMPSMTNNDMVEFISAFYEIFINAEDFRKFDDIVESLNNQMVFDLTH